MSDKFLNDNNNEEEKKSEDLNNENEEKTSNEAKTESIDKDKPLLPRKRMIVKNYQLHVSIAIVLIALLSIFVWKCFFDNSITGVWHFIKEGSYTETYDQPLETADSVQSQTTEYTQRVSYEFTEDGRCIVTIGTTSIEGMYDIYSTEDGNILSAYVFNNYSAVLYGNFSYEIKGNIFTGKKLIITDMNTEDVLKLDEGEGENPLKPFDNPKLDDRFTGTWKDEMYGLTYDFTDDGYLTIKTNDGMEVQHVYTIVEEGTLLVKYFGATESSYSFVYSFDEENNLTVNGSLLEKIG